VNRFAAETDPQRLLVKATGRAGKLDPFKPLINQRWNEGVTSAAALRREIADRGRAGSVQAVERYVRQFRGADGRSRAGRNPLQAPPAASPPKTRQVTRWLLTHPDRLEPADQARLDAATAQCPHLGILAAHVRTLAKIMSLRRGETELEDRLSGAEASGLPQLQSFAHGIRRDQQAVTAGLSLPYSSAAKEGNVNKIKLIKRQCYG
jgi:transposase